MALSPKPADPWHDRPPMPWESWAMSACALLFMVGAFTAAFVPWLRLRDRPGYGVATGTITKYYDHTHYGAVLAHASIALASSFAFLGFAVLLSKHLLALDRAGWQRLPHSIYALGAVIVWLWGLTVGFAELTLVFVAPVDSGVGVTNLLVHLPVFVPAIGAALTMVGVALALRSWHTPPLWPWLVFVAPGVALVPLVLVWHPALLLYALWVPTMALGVAGVVLRGKTFQQNETATGAP